MEKILKLLILLLFVSCSEVDDTPLLIFDQKAFDANRAMWEENEILNYKFSQEYFSLSIGSQPAITSIVKNGELDTIFFISYNDTVFTMQHMRHYETIDDVYDFIEYLFNYCEEEIYSEEELMKGAKIEVEYNEAFYYPTEIKCTGYYPTGIDGGLSIRVIFSEFNIIQ